MDGLLRIGTRGSELALRQVEIFKAMLKEVHPGLATEIVIIHTAGDMHTDIPLNRVNSVGKVMDKGVFIATIEEALADGRIDCAVHSLKDMPGQLDPRFRLSAILPREDNRDVLLLKEGVDPHHLTLGTSSVRRARLVRSYWSGGARSVTLRGNVPTRLRKLATSAEMDGIILARAGLNRLGYTGKSIEVEGVKLFPVDLDADAFMPALCQGAIAIETRVDDQEAHALVSPVNHGESELCVRVERHFLARLGADCSVPVGGYATCNKGVLMFSVIYFTPDDLHVRIVLRGDADSPEDLAERAHAELLRRLA